MENQNKKEIPTSTPEITRKVGVVHTYADDMANVMENAEGPSIKKIIHEEEEEEKVKENLSPESKKNKLFLWISLLLSITALLLLSVTLTLTHKNSSVAVAPQFTPLIFTDKSQFLEVDGLSPDRIAQTVLNEVNQTTVKTGGIEGIYLTNNKAVVGLRAFLTLIKANVDQTQIPFVSDNFLIGVLNGQNKDLFILLKTRSFVDIFPSLRAWENKMFSDLHGFFGVPISSDTSYLLTENFQDSIISNKNARILYDKNGGIVLMYVFLDDTSVLITNSTEAVNEVLLRLSSNQITQ